jgi:hypothetical protein
VALDAHGEVRRAARLRLPPLPRGDWDWTLDLRRADAESLGNRFAAARRSLASESPRRVPALTVDGAPAMGEVVDTATFAGRPVALVSVPLEDGGRELRLAEPADESQAGDGAYVISPVGTPSTADGYRLLVVAGALIALPDHAPDGALLLSWDAATAHAAWAAEPRRVEVGGAWRDVATWQHGLALATDDGLRLLAFDASGWREVAGLSTGAPASALAARGDHLYVALPGEVRVYDLAAPSSPRLAGRLAGSSHRDLVVLPDGGVALGSQGFATPWIEVGAGDLTAPLATSGSPAFAPAADGFRPAPDFLPILGER